MKDKDQDWYDDSMKNLKQSKQELKRSKDLKKRRKDMDDLTREHRRIKRSNKNYWKQKIKEELDKYENISKHS